jgi:ADP-dependent NAD(P)H-hydrate dehydratase / NAD(P)H-hydrate epimerase
MQPDYWQKQDLAKPLFEDLIWSKPEQKSLAGKLLIVGGNLHAITAPAEAFGFALGQGIGECRVVMPLATKKLLGPKSPAEIEFADSTAVGSFSTKALDELKAYSTWADALLLAGNFGRSSETAILLEKLLEIDKLLIISGDSLDSYSKAEPLLNRDATTLVITFHQLQKILKSISFDSTLTSEMGVAQAVEFTHKFSTKYKVTLVFEFLGFIFVSVQGQVVTTKMDEPLENWQTKLAATAAVWQLQNPTKPLEALATAVTQLG